MGTLIPPLPPPPPAPTPEMVDKWPSPCGQMYQRSWQRMNSLDLIFQRVPTKIRGCGCQSSLGKGGGGGGQVWIKNGTSHNYGTQVITICMENPEIPGRIQMERFILVEIIRKKSNTFRGITFFPFLPKRLKFSVPFVWITSARLHVERKWKIYRYFVNGTTKSCTCFRCQKKY